MSTDGDRTVGKQDLSAFGRRRDLAFRPAEVSATPTTAVEEPEEPQRAAESSTAPAEATAAPAKATRRSSSAKSRSSVGASPTRERVVKFNRSVYILTELRRQLKQETESKSETLTHVVLTAIEAHYDQLEKAIADARAMEAKPSRGAPLFEVDQRQYRRDHEDRQPVTLRLTARNEQVLDRIQIEVGARNRSDLVEAALILAFGARTTRKR